MKRSTGIVFKITLIRRLLCCRRDDRRTLGTRHYDGPGGTSVGPDPRSGSSLAPFGRTSRVVMSTGTHPVTQTQIQTSPFILQTDVRGSSRNGSRDRNPLIICDN